jgi:CheY-like chemotaxis protein
MDRTCHRILLIDDDPDSTEAFRAVLEMAGFEVVVAFHGADALAILRDDRNFCTILLDLVMPVMDGRAFREAQQRDPVLADIPVVILSGDVELADEARQMGVADYLPKPPDPGALVHLIERRCHTSPVSVH